MSDELGSPMEVWRTSCSNLGRWGADDRMGTLNHVDETVRLRAVRTVTEGVSVSCSRPVPKATDDDGSTATVHLMVRTRSRSAASDYLGLAPHGEHVTHLDALSHFSSAGTHYNDHPLDGVGPVPNSPLGVHLDRDGIVTRGVLVDLPRALGRRPVPGEAIGVRKLHEAVAELGIEVRPGDALLVRMGRWPEVSARRAGQRPLAGLRPDCLPWLHNSDVSIVGCDGITDVQPSVTVDAPLPIHEIALARLGLQLLDNLDLDEVARTCAQLSRWEFLFVVAPLVIVSGTASPVNPLALF